MSQNKPDIKPWILFVIIVLVLIYLLTLGKADFLSELNDDRKQDLSERKKLLDHRYNRVQGILDRKKALKKKLETICKRVLLGVRLALVLLLIGGIIITYSYYKFTLLDLAGYFGVAAIGILLIGFIIVGSPANFFTMWTFAEKKLTLKIYGKYIDIDQDIAGHEKQLKKITSDKMGVEKELKDITEAEAEIKKIIEDDNSDSTQKA